MYVRVLGSLAAMLLALALPDVAHAGFGRRGSASSHGSSSGGGGRSSAGRSDVHVDFGSGSAHREPPRSEPRHEQHHSGSSHHSGSYRTDFTPSRMYWGPNYHVWGYSFGYIPPPPAAQETLVVDAPPAAADGYDPTPRPRVATALAGELTFGGRGFLLGTQLSWEGERLGFLLNYTAAFAPIADTPDYDTIHLALAHFTYALVSGERGRLRAEAGLHVAVATEVTFMAPGLGVSGVLGLVESFGLEARVFGNFWPYTQLDARAGLAFGTGAFGLSFGLRAVYLNDQGVLGALNAGDTSDSFYGPYVNVAIAL